MKQDELLERLNIFEKDLDALIGSDMEVVVR